MIKHTLAMSCGETKKPCCGLYGKDYYKRVSRGQRPNKDGKAPGTGSSPPAERRRGTVFLQPGKSWKCGGGPKHGSQLWREHEETPQLLLPMASFFNESSLATSKEEASHEEPTSQSTPQAREGAPE